MENSEAISWYVEEARRLLEDQQRRAESLRTRGGQLAGFGAVFLALIGGSATEILHEAGGRTRTVIAVSMTLAAICLSASIVLAVIAVVKPRSYASISAGEITNYLSDRFLNEQDL